MVIPHFYINTMTITKHFKARQKERSVVLAGSIERQSITTYNGTRQLKSLYTNGSVVISELSTGNLLTCWKN